MLFADDAIVFAEATTSNVHNVLGVVEIFCQGSSQKINVLKSLVFNSPGILRQVANVLFRTNHFQKSSKDFFYLGFHLLKSSCCYGQLEHLVSQAKKKISSLNLKSLFQAGRLMIIKSVL